MINKNCNLFISHCNWLKKINLASKESSEINQRVQYAIKNFNFNIAQETDQTFWVLETVKKIQIINPISQELTSLPYTVGN